MPAILRISASQTSGAPNISALVFACSFEGPPSTRYDATVNGAPANPISGVPPLIPASSPTSEPTAAVMNGRCSGVRSGIAATSASVRTGRATTGPTPGLMSRSTPTALSGSTMSEKKMAASTPYRRTGWRVISVTISAFMQDSSMLVPSRRARYSGSERPGLAHEPHRGVRHRLPAHCLEERAVAEVVRLAHIGLSVSGVPGSVHIAGAACRRPDPVDVS